MKDFNISKELIEEVMKDKGTFETININKNELSTFGVLGHHIFSINIYELDFICREWAYTKGFIVEIGVHPIIKQNRNDRYYFYAIKTLNGELLKKSNVDEIMKSEPTATLKACEWVLENIK